MLVPGPPSTPAASSSAESEAAPAGEEAAPAAAAIDTAGQPAAAGPEGAPATGLAEAGAEGGREGPSAPASEPAAPALPAAPSAKRSRIFFHFKEVRRGPAGRAGRAGPWRAAATCASSPFKNSRSTSTTCQPHPPSPTYLPFQVSGQYILKPGDEVVFVMHTNLKSGELNAQRVRRTKEGPELPEPGEGSVPTHRASSPRQPCSGGGLPGTCPGPHKKAAPSHVSDAAQPQLARPAEPAPKPAPKPAVNPNRQKYSGNLSAGSYKAPKIAKGPGAALGRCRAPRWAAPSPMVQQHPVPGEPSAPGPCPCPQPARDGCHQVAHAAHL